MFGWHWCLWAQRRRASALQECFSVLSILLDEIIVGQRAVFLETEGLAEWIALHIKRNRRRRIKKKMNKKK